MRLCQITLVVTSVVAAYAATAALASSEKHVYKNVDDQELVIYVTKPSDWKAADRRPAILFFHGGGWVGGKPGQFTDHAKYFASRGLVCFQAQYRLLDKKKKDPPTICIRDARSAMRWVRNRADEFGIDPNRIATAGGSAGGHLAATLGTINLHDEPGEDTTVSVRANAMLLFNPVFDNGPDGWGTARVGDRYPEFSPAHNITPQTPPAIVFLGDADKLIPVATLDSFQAKMTEAGVRCDTLVFPGMPHGFFNKGRGNEVPYVKTVRVADEFLASLGWLEGEPTLPDVESPAGKEPLVKKNQPQAE